MEFRLKTGPQGHVYLPKKVRQAFGTEILLFPDNDAGVIYSEKAETSDVIASLEVIIQHLRLQQRKKSS
jgi:hypothetical protein